MQQRRTAGDVARLGRRRGWLLLIGVVTGYLGAAPSIVWASGWFFAAAFPVLIPVAIWIYTLVFAFASLWFTHYCLAALEQYAQAIGLAFQVHDDILDVIEEAMTRGLPEWTLPGTKELRFVGVLGESAWWIPPARPEAAAFWERLGSVDARGWWEAHTRQKVALGEFLRSSIRRQRRARASSLTRPASLA